MNKTSFTPKRHPNQIHYTPNLKSTYSSIYHPSADHSFYPGQTILCQTTLCDHQQRLFTYLQMARRNNNTNCSFRFKRVTEAFNELARARICNQSNNSSTTSSSNGSSSTTDDHQHNSSSPELSDLIESFIEDNYKEEDKEEDKDQMIITSEDDQYCCKFVPDTKKMLKDLLQYSSNQDHEKEEDTTTTMNNIRVETELACRVIGNTTSPQGFKRALVTRLRDRGFASGLCKSHWDKMAGFPAGDYEYVDVIVAGTRYIVEVSLAGEFSIARPTNYYLTLLGEFPQIYVGKEEDLKKVVKLMCGAAKESLKNRDMHLPPWRRNGYMEAKWFGFYKRITTCKDVDMVMRKKQGSDSGEAFTGKCSKEGIQVCSPMIFSYRCGGEVAGKVGLRIGNLAQAFDGRGMVSNGREM